MTIQQSLIDYLESQPEVAGRYENLRCVSYDAGKREGMMSIVFRATDKITGDQVALKYIDPRFVAAGDIVALKYFQREFEMMSHVERNSRSANLCGDRDVLPFPIKAPGGGPDFTLSVSYFPLEWLDGDINRLFFDQANVSSEEKLSVLRDVFLAARSIHLLDVAHRDIKRDNVRIVDSTTPNARLKLIDFGMAIHLNSSKAVPVYTGAVGAPGFAPPESFLGFEGARDLARERDAYSLGALVYSVFNSADFSVERQRSTDFLKILEPHRPSFLACNSDTQRKDLWNSMIQRSRFRLAPPDIDGPFTSLPASISKLVGRIYESLCAFDYRDRPKMLDSAITDLESASRHLANSKSERVALRRKKEMRNRKIAKQERKLARLNEKKALDDA